MLNSALRRLASESAVYGMAAVTAKLTGFVLVPLVTRTLTPQEIGTLAVIDATLELVRRSGNLGLQFAADRFVMLADSQQERLDAFKTASSFHVGVAILLSTVLFLMAPVVAGGLQFVLPNAASLIRLSAVTLPFNAAISWYVNLARYERNPRFVLMQAGSQAIVMIASSLVLLLVFDRKAAGLLESRLLSAACVCVALRTLGRPKMVEGDFRLDLLTPMFRYGLPMVPTALTVWVTTTSDRLLLNILRDQSEVAIYAVAASLSAAANVPVGAFVRAFGPFSLEDYRKTGKTDSIVATLWGFSLAASVVTLIALASSRHVVVLFAGAPYASAGSVVPVLVAAACLEGVRNIASFGATLVANSRPILWASASGAVLNVVLNVVLIPWYGVNGAALATLASTIAVVYLTFRWAGRLVSIGHDWYRLNFVLAVVLLSIVSSTWWPSYTVHAAAMACCVIAGGVLISRYRNVP